MLKRIYIWEFPVRWSHWLVAVSIVVLSVTGYYISNPFIHATSSKQYIMGWMRLIHLIAAAVFNCDLILRFYWFFAGNKHSSIGALFPLSRERRKEFSEMFRFYFFMRSPSVRPAGHDALFSWIYLIVFILYITQTFTGFALLSLSNKFFIYDIFGGWLLSVFSIQGIRLYHHMVMWVLIAFVIVHIYGVWRIDKYQKDGTISSIFTGYKTLEQRD